MSKFTKIKLELAKMLCAFSEIKTDKAILTWDSEDDLAEGMDVYVTDAEGNYEPAPDGDYVTDDSKTIVVKDGKVEAIKDPEAEVAPEETPAEEEVSAEEEVPEVVVEEPEVEVEPEAEDDIRKAIDELYVIVNRLAEEIAAMKGKGDEVEKKVEEMSKMSAAFSAEEEIEMKKEATLSGIASIDKKLKNFIG